MPPQIWRLPQTPDQVSDQTPVTTEPLGYADSDYKDGFAPVGIATIIPHALDDKFKWEWKYKRPLVQVDPNQKDLQDAPLGFEVIIYQGSSPDYTNSPQRFVFIGESGQVPVGFNNTYMRYQDLVDRLGPEQTSFYKGDQDRLNAGQLPFPIWDMSGAAPNYFQKKESFEAFLDSPSKGWNERDSQMFAFTCSWASAAMFPPKESFSTVMRFFDRPIANVQLHFRIDHAVIHLENFKALVNQTRDEATSPGPIQKRFLPTSNYTVTSFLLSPSGGVFENNKTLLGSHPMGFYEIWVDESSYNALMEEGVILPPYQFAPRPKDWDVQLERNSNKVKLTYSDETIPLFFDRTTLNFETVTPITPLKLAAARNKKCEPDQNRVMGWEAPYIKPKVWRSDFLEDHIEWLHRSAFSYGGLGKLGSKSSQTVDNLVLGTKSANMVMSRTEEFVKRYCNNEKTTVTVKTKVQWHPPNTNIPILEPLEYCSWLAPWIEYTITADHATKPIDRTIYFETQARVTPLQFDLELGQKVEAACFGWQNVATGDEYDK